MVKRWVQILHETCAQCTLTLVRTLSAMHRSTLESVSQAYNPVNEPAHLDISRYISWQASPAKSKAGTYVCLCVPRPNPDQSACPCVWTLSQGRPTLIINHALHVAHASEATDTRTKPSRINTVGRAALKAPRHRSACPARSLVVKTQDELLSKTRPVRTRHDPPANLGSNARMHPKSYRRRCLPTDLSPDSRPHPKT